MTAEPVPANRRRGPLLAAAASALSSCWPPATSPGTLPPAARRRSPTPSAQAQKGKLPCGNTSSVQLGGGGGFGGAAGGGFGGGAGAGAGGGGARGGGFFLQRLCGGNAAAGGQAGGQGRGLGGGPFGAGGVTGRISAVHGARVTVQTRAGALTVKVGPHTAITKTGAGSRRDLKPGQTASVTSTASAGGARTATRIFVLPCARGGG